MTNCKTFLFACKEETISVNMDDIKFNDIKWQEYHLATVL